MVYTLGITGLLSLEYFLLYGLYCIAFGLTVVNINESNKGKPIDTSPIFSCTIKTSQLKANMAKKQFFIIVDTETSITDKVVDFAAVVIDRKGIVHHQCAILVQSVFAVDSLFYDKNAPGIWSQANVSKRMDGYNAMLDTGSRMLASVNAINRWLAQAQGKYNPELTAYNLAFDNGKCANTGIDLTMFSARFCLWAASVGNICNTRAYRQFACDNHLFNARTKFGNMTYSTTAEAVTGFLSGTMTDEPHTALEDIIGYEIPTLAHILNKRDWREKMIAYNWKSHQVKDHFKAK